MDNELTKYLQEYLKVNAELIDLTNIRIDRIEKVVASLCELIRPLKPIITALSHENQQEVK